VQLQQPASQPASRNQRQEKQPTTNNGTTISDEQILCAIVQKGDICWY
jgi:hypothetical protein